MNRGRLIGLLVVAVGCAGTLAQAESARTMNLKLESAATVKGERLDPGDYKLSWTAQGAEADLTIAQKGKVVAKAHVSVVEKEKPAPEDMVLFRKGSDGSQVISEIRHRGEKAVLVLSAS